MSNKLSLPDDARQWLARRYENQHKAWLAGEGAWPLGVPLGSPVEADVARDYAVVRGWAEAWQRYKGSGRIVWEERRWARLGQQRIPVRLEFDAPAEVAEAVGQDSRWRCAVQRVTELGGRWPELVKSPALVRHFAVLADYSKDDFDRLVALLDWLVRHPDSGHYLRQVPVEGLDTKWLGTRTAAVTSLLGAMRNSSEADFYALTGLRRTPWRLRVRFLCPELRTTLGGLQDVEVPLDELKAMKLAVRRAVIVENLETGIALPDMPGTVALMKLGNAAGVIEELPWLRPADVVYWGDIDTHGFAILDRARRALPQLRSILMNAKTLVAHQPLWVEESVQHPATELSHLTPAEREVFEGLRSQRWGHNVRLEQERLPLSHALEALEVDDSAG